MIRKDKVLTYLLLAVIVAFQIVPASAFQVGNAQVWGHRYRANSYWGSDIYQNTPNPSISGIISEIRGDENGIVEYSPEQK